MLRCHLLLAALLLITSSHAQSFKKYPISNSGCSVYMFCDPGKFDYSLSEDSSKVYTAQCIKDDMTYGVICIKLLNPVTDLKQCEGLMVSYLDYLKSSFQIKSAVGYGKGNLLNNNVKTTGIVDYWKDTEDYNWKMKSWTDGNYIGVLYVRSLKDVNDVKADPFLNSFRLPGM